MCSSALDVASLLRDTLVAQVEHHPTLSSTNDRAKDCALARSGLIPLLIVADQQTAGRGRGANRWWTGPGGLACSLLVDLRPFGVERSRGPMVSLAAAIAVVRTIAPLLAQQTVGIHWPNDVIVAGRKLSGILVEVLPNHLTVVGIGLNTNNTMREAPEDLRGTAVTLRDLSGTEHDHTTILHGLLRHVEGLLRQLGSAPDAVGAEADRLCLQRGQTLVLQQGRREVVGRCLGIGPDGTLVLDTPQGKRSFYSGVLKRG